jgi:hypothetical protein
MNKYALLLAHSLMHRNDVLKAGILGTKRKISSVTRDPIVNID